MGQHEQEEELHITPYSYTISNEETHHVLGIKTVHIFQMLKI
jgi:hypothetical protein